MKRRAGQFDDPPSQLDAARRFMNMGRPDLQPVCPVCKHGRSSKKHLNRRPRCSALNRAKGFS